MQCDPTLVGNLCKLPEVLMSKVMSVVNDKSPKASHYSNLHFASLFLFFQVSTGYSVSVEAKRLKCSK